MEPPDDTTNPGGSSLEAAIQDRLDALEAGHTRRGTRTALNKFTHFLQTDRTVDSLTDLDAQDCRRWAQKLRRDVRDDQLKASTARQYYARVRASCTWWVEDERLETNPAKAKRAESELPEDTAQPDRQSWTPNQREQLLRAADQRVDETHDKNADNNTDTTIDDVLVAHRDRSLAYLLAWSGVRGGEILRDPMDEKRNGITWQDVDDGVIRLLGKTRDREAAPLRDVVARRLNRWRRILDPPTDDWPVFPPLSKGSLTSALEDAVPTKLHLESDASVRERLDAFADHGVMPPAASTNTGRTAMQRLSEVAGIDVEEGYLQPHGGRRGLGNEIYDRDPVAAQDTLRHKSIETTNKAYREQQQAQRARQLDEMFDEGK